MTDLATIRTSPSAALPAPGTQHPDATRPQPSEPVESSLGFRGRWLPSEDPGVLIGESWAAPGGGAGPLHRHLHQDETFEVLAGAITVRLGRARRVVGAGESFHVPAGAPHTFVNHTRDEAHFLTRFTPPLRLQDLFAALHAAGGRPGPLAAARLMGEFPDEFFYVAHVPVRVQRALGALLRALADRR